MEKGATDDDAYLETGPRRVALLLLGALARPRLAARALAARGLSLSAGHCL